MPRNILFVCSQNRLRSPTAEKVFAHRPDLEVASAGTNNDAETPLSGELVDWAGVGSGTADHVRVTGREETRFGQRFSQMPTQPERFFLNLNYPNRPGAKGVGSTSPPACPSTSAAHIAAAAGAVWMPKPPWPAHQKKPGTWRSKP